MATQIAERQANPIVAFRTQLERRADEFKMVLPAHISPEKFQRTVLTAIQSEPTLLDADRQSLLMSCMKAAQDGLLPDKREAALVTFKENKKVGNQWESRLLVQYMPMVYGLRKKILQSGEVTDITARAVYRREMEEGAFIYEEGTEAMLRHRPLMDLTEEEAGDDQIIAFYSMATYKDGSKSYEVMRRFEVDKVREKSQTGATRDRRGQARNPSGPWVEWYPEQGKKTVMRRHSKTLPMSGDLLDVEAADDTLYANSALRALHSAAPAAEEPVAAAVPPTRDETRQIPHNPDTGEVLDMDAMADLDRQSFREMDRMDGMSRGEAEAWFVRFKKDMGAAQTPEQQDDIHERYAHDISEMEAQHNDIHRAAMALVPIHSEGPADDQRGEAHNGAEEGDPARITANEIIAEIEAAADIDELGAVMKRNRSMIVKLGEDLGNEIHGANNARKYALAGAK